MAQRKPRSRNVFVSSTSEDLKDHRKAARDAAISAGFLPVMMEYFVASGKKPPLAACLAKVDDADLVVAIVAHRYGWVPPDQGGDDHKSITWLECDHAVDEGKEVLAFIVGKNFTWPPELRESYRTMAALEEGTFSPELAEEVKRNLAKLGEFKDWLNSRGIRATFTTPEDLRGKVEAALRESKSKPTRTRKRPSAERTGQDDPRQYLQFLREETAYIDIRGLGVGSGKAHSFPIEDLYIPLTTARATERNKAKPESEEVHLELPEKVELHEALTNNRLVIIGDPGSGKTTFLRRIAFALCQTWLKEDPQAAESRLGIRDQLFPVFISVGKLIEYIGNAQHSGSRDAPTTPTTKDSAAWLPHYLANASQELSWELSAAFFTEKLKAGSCILLLDGLDEAPNRRDRESVARLLGQAGKAYGKCRFVVTSRPLAYSGKAVLTDFPQVQIEPLENEAIETFLQRWSEGLFPDSPKRSRDHCAELLKALRHLPEVRRMAHNPVMLTALAVVHWNERRLPEQRADLYESIVTWLLRSREQRPDRASADRTTTLLGHLALAMHNNPKGRQVQVSKGWAAEAIAPQFRDAAEAERKQKAEKFLDEEEVDSGVIVSRGSEIRFWHLTFQEYLAARAIAGQGDAAQQKLLLTRDTIHKPEWREVVLLLAGILHVKQGVEKVDGLFSAVLDQLGKKPSLMERARCVGLLGALVRDLTPLDYKPADPRYQRTLDDVMGIFDADKSKGLEFQVRLEAAEALGQAGDPRLAEDNWITIEAGSFLSSIDEALVDAFKQHRRNQTSRRGKRLSVASVNRELATLRRLLRLAQKWRVIDRVPKIKMLRGEHEREFVLSFEHEKLYLEMAPESLRDPAILMLDEGLRVRETRLLEWPDVLLTPAPGARFGYLTIRAENAKNAKKRNLPLTARAVEMLKQRGPAQQGYVFTRSDGRPLYQTWLNQQHSKLRDTLKLPEDFVPHSFRHTYATRLGEGGADAFTIMKLMGHSTVLVSQALRAPDA